MERLSKRVARDGITVSAEMIGSADHGRYEWAVTLHRPDGREMRLNDYSGPDEPTVLDVVGILLSVASRTEGTESYEEWAGDFEPDPEKWQGRETYALQCRETGKLREFLGSSALDAYLYETERDD